MKNPLIALLTDFGEEDFFVASLKGVILKINPEAHLVDISHSLPPFNIEAGAFLLSSCFSYFPDGTIFLLVVDPSVGSDRRILLAEADSFRFIAPDNGLLGPILDRAETKSVRTVTNPHYFLPQPSATFEARDKMAPAAAWLSRGISPDEFGEEVSSWVPFNFPEPEFCTNFIEGQVIYIDRFGNLISNISRADMERLSVEESDLVLEIKGRDIFPIVRSYAFASAGEALFLLGSMGHVEVAVSAGSAAAQFDAGPGDRIRLKIKS